jgi:hypothetical protein
MDRAVSEMVAAMDGDELFPYNATQPVQTLEAIVAFHISHGHNGAWVDLPLQNADRNHEVQTA